MTIQQWQTVRSPGPWYVDMGEIYDANSVPVVFMNVRDELFNVADARLIANAPEMLVVLKRVIDMANCAMEYEGVDDAHTLKRAMERISKAKRECERAVEKATMEGTNGKKRSLD